MYLYYNTFVGICKMYSSHYVYVFLIWISIMNISYDHYKIFYYVAKYGSFTQAAEVLYNNQPNLTRAIKCLESSLGCRLFVRSNKGVRLTPDGQRLYEHISVALEHIRAAEEELSMSKSLQKGIVSIGASEIALRCFLLPILNEYRSKYPGVRIKISNHSTPQALSRLRSGLVDIAIVTTPLDVGNDLIEKELKPFYEIPVGGESFAHLCSKDEISLKELSENPIVSLGDKTSTYEFYLKYFQKYGIDFSVDIEAATADQILPLVEHNLGIAFVPEDFLNDGNTKHIYRIPLDASLPERAISLVKKRADSLSLPARELERMILEYRKI